MIRYSKLFWAYDINRDYNAPLRVTVEELAPEDPDFAAAKKATEFWGFRDEEDVLASRIRFAEKFNEAIKHAS